MESKETFSNLSNDFELVWSVTNVSLTALSENVEVISSPVIPLNFLDTKWRLHLQFIDCKFEVRLERCRDNGPRTVYIDMVNFAHDYYQAVNHSSRYAFKQGDIYPLFQFSKCVNIYEKEFIFDPSKDELEIRCTIFPDSKNYLDYLLLSGDMQYSSLLTTYFSEFPDAFFCMPTMKMPSSYRFSFFHTRAPEVQLRREIRLDSDIQHINDPSFNNDDFNLRKRIYAEQVDLKLDERFYEVRLSDSPFYAFGTEKKFRRVPHRYTAKTDIIPRRKSFRLIFDSMSTIVDNRVRTFTTFGIHWRLEISFLYQVSKFSFRMMPLNLVQSFPMLVVRYFASIRCVCSNRWLWNAVVIDNWSHNAGRKFNQETEISEYEIVYCCDKRYFHINLCVWNGNSKFTFEAEEPKIFVQYPLSGVLTFSTYMLELFESSKLYDTDIKMPDANIRAHRDILSARSPVFKNMFCSHMMETSKYVVNICDFQKSVIYKLVKYIYCAEVGFETTEEAIQLAYAADKYEIMLLKYRCFLYLYDNLNVDNAIEIYITCHFLEEKEFKNYVKSYIQESESVFFSEQQLTDFKRTWPDLYFEVFLKEI